MQSFYGTAFVASEHVLSNGHPPHEAKEAQVGTFTTGGSSSSAVLGTSLKRSFYNDGFWSKAKVPPAPPIFAGSGRADAAVMLDRRLRSVESIPALMSVVTLQELPSFDVGNLVIALAAGARVVEERTVPTLRFGYPAWNSLLSRVHDCIHCLEPRGLAMVAHSAAKLGYREMALWSELTRCASAKSEMLNSTDLAKICWAVSKLDLVHEFPAFWQRMEAVVLSAAASAASVDLSMLAWAFGTGASSVGAASAICAVLAQNTWRLLEDLTPQCLANLCWAMARLDASMPLDDALHEGVLRRARAMAEQFLELDVTHFCWALATLDQVDPDLFELLAEHLVQGGLVRRCSSQMVTQLLWSFAVSKVMHQELFEALAVYVVRHVHVMEASQVSNCAWAFATANFWTSTLVEALVSVCRGGKFRSCNATEFCALLWALAKFGQDEPEVLQELLRGALKRLADLNDAGLVNLVGSLVTLACSNACGLHMDPQRADLAQLLDSVHRHFMSEPMAMTTELLVSLCRGFCRAERLDMAMELAEKGERPKAPALLAILLSCAERSSPGSAPALWAELASLVPGAPALRTACRFASGHSQSFVEAMEDLPDTGPSVGAMALQRCWLELLTFLDAGSRTVAEALEWIEDFGASCQELDLCLGPRAAVLDELMSRLPQLVLLLNSELWSLRLAARVQEYGGRVVCIQEDPFHVAVARSAAELLGLSGSIEFFLGQPQDVLPNLLERHGRSAVDVLMLRGRGEDEYLTDLRLVKELGLFTSGCIVADHLLQRGSPRFLQEMGASPRHSLELVEVVDPCRGSDWMALCAVQAVLKDQGATKDRPSRCGAGRRGVAKLTATAREAWRLAGEELPGKADFQHRMTQFAFELGLAPSQRFSEMKVERPLCMQVCQSPSVLGFQPSSDVHGDSDTTPSAPFLAPGGVTEKSPRVAQEYLRTLDFKRWLTEVDPSGGCLEYLPQTMKLHESVEQVLESYSGGQGLEIFLEALGVTSSDHAQRFRRWFQVDSEAVGILPTLPQADGYPSTTLASPCGAVVEDSMVDLKHLSFSDWLASMEGLESGPHSVNLQQYLPSIQESYDTVSQIATTYTIVAKNGREEKTLDPQLYDDFGILPEHQVLFHSWFVRFCGINDDPSTPHFGPEGREVAASPTEGAQPPAVAAVAAAQEAEIAEAPAAESAASGGMFDFDELEEVAPCGDEIGDDRLEADQAHEMAQVEESQRDDHNGSEAVADNSAAKDAENEAVKEDAKSSLQELGGGGGFFDFDDLDDAETNG